MRGSAATRSGRGWREVASGILAAIVALGCSSDEGSGADSADAGPGADAAPAEGGGALTYSFVTYNTAMTPAVKGATERLPLIVEALAALDADVVCLQELFSQVTSPSDFADGIKATYPHAFWSEEEQTASGNGVLILSRTPITRSSALVYATRDPLGLTDRVALGAELTLGEDTVSVLCTHLLAGLDAAGIAARSAQVDELMTWADDEQFTSQPTFLLGDFNMGPDPVGACTTSTDPACLEPDLETYQRVLQTFEDGAADLDECTQCRDSFMALQTFNLFLDEPDQRIDHCFYRDIAPLAPVGAARVLDAPQSVESGGDVLATLSDHYGVRCEFSR